MPAPEKSIEAPADFSTDLVWDGTSEDEVAFLNQILLAGFDQGCFIRPSPAELLASGELGAYLDYSAQRSPAAHDAEDPFAVDPIPTAPIPGDSAGHVILNQRCDLVRCLRDEPVVELARVRLVTDASRATSARLNSPRFLQLSAKPDSGGSWVADLRHREFLPKLRLVEHDVVFPVPAGRERRDLSLRIGRRFSRDAVPDDIAAGFQAPFANWIKRSSGRVKSSKKFAEVLVERRDDGSLLVVGLVKEDADFPTAEVVFKQWLEEFASKTDFRLAPESAAITADQLPLGWWKDAHKIDLDQVSRGSKADEETALPFR